MSVIQSERRVSLLRCRRSSVAIIVALLAPVLAGAASLGIEVSNWSVDQMRMQSAADAAALAGAITYDNVYASTSNAQTAAQDAANAAANLAEINSVPGPNSPSWDSTSQTLTDTNLTVQIVKGVRTASDTAIQVNVHESVPLEIARIISSASSVTVSGSSTAELISSGSGSASGPQPCVFAMRTAADGGTGISASGYISLTAEDCSVRSNAGTPSSKTATGTPGINFSGGGSFNTGGLYTAGTIDIPNWVTVKGGEYPNDGTVADPYASNTALQSALSDASTETGTTISCSNQQCFSSADGKNLPSASDPSKDNGSYCTGQITGSVTCYMEPGVYGSLTALSGGPYTFNFAAGLYIFHGNIDLENNTTSNGTGVTIVLSGYFKGSNTFNFNVTAPTSAEATSTGGITGVVLAGSTSDITNSSGKVTQDGFSLSGNPQFLADGVVYFPNATFNAENSPTLGGSSDACLEILAANVLLSGSTNIASDCSTLNAAGFGSNPGSTTYTATLVQ